MISYKNKICAVIVTYNPDIKILMESVGRIEKFCTIIIVNNGSKKIELSNIALSYVIECEKNLGLARGLNVGVEKAIASGYRYVVLFDQDTIPTQSYLMQINELSKEMGVSDVIYGANFFDRKSEDTNRRRLNYVITSGTFFDVNIYKKIGGFSEELFIDYIDIEWCARALKFGIICETIKNGHLEHSLGERCVKLFNKPMYLHSPERDYYIIRNCYYVMRLDYFTLRFKILEFAKTIFRSLFYVIVSDKKKSHISNVVFAHKDGVLGVFGERNI
jgi:rhamnosyltransferase